VSEAEWQVAAKGRLRAVALVDAAEQAALTPVPVERLHALAYLADVLSPVWGLQPFDPVALKTDREPFFGRFQDQLDDLVVVGLLEVVTFGYIEIPNSSIGEVALRARYHLRYEAEHLAPLLSFIRADEELGRRLQFFVALASAVARLPDEEIARAVTKDATWDDADIPVDDLVRLRTPTGKRRSTRTDGTLAVFDELSPGGAPLGGAARLRLYTAFLAERLKAA
jgi:hypothetical protein